LDLETTAIEETVRSVCQHNYSGNTKKRRLSDSCEEIPLNLSQRIDDWRPNAVILRDPELDNVFDGFSTETSESDEPIPCKCLNLLCKLKAFLPVP